MGRLKSSRDQAMAKPPLSAMFAASSPMVKKIQPVPNSSLTSDNHGFIARYLARSRASILQWLPETETQVFKTDTNMFQLYELDQIPKLRQYAYSLKTVEKVENAIFGQIHDEGIQDPGVNSSDKASDRARSNDSAPLEAVLSILAGELQKLNKNIEPSRKRRYEYDPFKKVTRPTKRQLQEIFGEQQQSVDEDVVQQGTRPASFRNIDVVQDHLDKLLESYFDHIQPWLSMIPIREFSNCAQNAPKQDTKIVLEAMTVATLRYVEIDAFTEIGNGNLDKAWPIIGSLTRTVECMGLSVESEGAQRKLGLLRDNSSLPEPIEWKKEEERRRIFWNVFILDRISSIIEGWSPAIDSAGIRRRLPMCGGNWFYNEPAITPYFGNWDQPIAQNDQDTSPCHSASNTGGLERIGSTSRSGRHSDNTTGDISKIGSLAYYIQSIDSLSQIFKTFLQSAVDFTNRQQVSLWLTKFKELDLRLVQ
ncbi:hypothetical protein IL306_009281 [Fusarium sp. DS 682]|nr:hypothetical protein IL306_009281 [Fusarium sp. DS 682]